MINKFHANLLNRVKVLSDNSLDCIVTSENFEQTQNDLDSLKISYTAYPVANCFYIKENYNQLLRISELTTVDFLSSFTKVSTLIHNTKNFLNIKKIQEAIAQLKGSNE